MTALIKYTREVLFKTIFKKRTLTSIFTNFNHRNTRNYSNTEKYQIDHLVLLSEVPVIEKRLESGFERLPLQDLRPSEVTLTLLTRTWRRTL